MEKNNIYGCKTAQTCQGVKAGWFGYFHVLFDVSGQGFGLPPNC